MNGLYLAFSSNNNILTNNTAIKNSGYGFDLDQSSSNILKNNIGQYNGKANYYDTGSNNILNNNMFSNPPSTPSFTFLSIISVLILLLLLKIRK